MTTTTASPSLIGLTRTRSPRLRLTVRGRRVLAALAALPAVAGLILALMAGGSATAARGASGAGTFETVTVTSGDTLWAIAAAVAPSADPRDVVDAIARLNGLAGGAVMPGQRLWIPLEYTAAP